MFLLKGFHEVLSEVVELKRQRTCISDAHSKPLFSEMERGNVVCVKIKLKVCATLTESFIEF